MAEGLSLEEGGIIPHSVVTAGPPNTANKSSLVLRETSGHCPLQSRRAESLTQAHSLEGLLFSHSSFSSWPQSREVTSFEISKAKTLFHWGCSSGRQNKFARLLVTKQEFFKQPQFLGAVPEELQRSWIQLAWGGGDAAPSSQNSRAEFKKGWREYSTLWWHTHAPVPATTLWKTPSTSAELLCTSTYSEQLPLSQTGTPKGQGQQLWDTQHQQKYKKEWRKLLSTWNSWDALLPEILAEEKETGTDTHNNYFLLHYNK